MSNTHTLAEEKNKLVICLAAVKDTDNMVKNEYKVPPYPLMNINLQTVLQSCYVMEL